MAKWLQQVVLLFLRLLWAGETNSTTAHEAHTVMINNYTFKD